MQRISKNTSTRSQNRRKLHSSAQGDDVDQSISDGEKAAKIFKYYRGWQNPYKTTITPLKLVSGKRLYKEHKEDLDRFAALAKKNNFDIDSYFKFCVIDCGIKESCIDACLSSTTMINEFCNHVKKQKKLEDIYKWFMMSVKSIVDECIKTQTYTTKDYLRHLIDSNKIGPYVAAGKISVYYLAAIPSFNKIISKLDYFSRLELQLLEDHFEIYHSEVNEAFLAKRKKMVNPIELTDLAILKTLKKIQQLDESKAV